MFRIVLGFIILATVSLVFPRLKALQDELVIGFESAYPGANAITDAVHSNYAILVLIILLGFGLYMILSPMIHRGGP